ncbi:hypothetical protein PV963_01100 [Streptomyces coeruleorubidus]|uniref:hypothetical protein n=1 Tax=Streptomyces coeruleorubidus TaxID=116188 RepID=UPI00237F0DBD|nr:hypothetical protein [Streptomyces coeruleorubidus]WDV49174.1 hypothetical protein PV963_01100 [Streptomyces coeruleorubidus]
MVRPEVGAALRHCAQCGGYEYGGAPACAVCRELVDGIVEEEWAAFLRHWDAAEGEQERVLAEMVAAEPDRHDWRVVDAALDRLVCPDCGDRLARGPAGCPACDRAHGFRYAAIETDRPGVPPGNEHAIRVNVSVVRRPQVSSGSEVLVRRMLLPLLLVGFLPTTEQAQRVSALVKRSPPGRRAQLVEESVEALAADLSRTRRAGPAAGSSPTSPDTPAASRHRSGPGRSR